MRVQFNILGDNSLARLSSTLGNKEWLKINEEKIKASFPQSWTPMQDVDAVKIAYALKMVGVNWSSKQEFGRIMVFFEKIGFLLRAEGNQVQANKIKVL